MTEENKNTKNDTPVRTGLPDVPQEETSLPSPQEPVATVAVPGSLVGDETPSSSADRGHSLPSLDPPPEAVRSLPIAVPTAVSMWNDPKLMNLSFRTARMLSTSALVPDAYRNSPENCLVAIDIANRMGVSPLMVMQNLFVVKGKPSWSGSFCAAAVNGSSRFTPLEYVFVGEPGTPSHGCYATATRLATGARCVSETVTMAMAKAEGWLNKAGSKWLTMPVQMMMYRAAKFFANTHCSDILLGLPTYEEVQDVRGYEPDNSQPVTVSLDQPE